MEEIIFIVRESEEDGGFIAEALDFGIITQAESWDELRQMVKDAVVCHFDDNQKRIIRLHQVKQEVITV